MAFPFFLFRNSFEHEVHHHGSCVCAKTGDILRITKVWETCPYFCVGADQFPTFLAHFVQHGSLVGKNQRAEVCHHFSICSCHLYNLVFPLLICTSK